MFRFPSSVLRTAASFCFCCCVHLAGAQSPDVDVLMRQGADAMHRGNPSEAEKYFSQVTAVAPALPDAYLGLGMAQLRAGNSDAAADSLQHAIALNPQLPGAHLFLGIALYQAHKMDAATDALNEELQVQPKNVEALTWLGIVELGRGHPELATEPFDRAVSLSPRDPNLLYYQGHAHGLVAQNAYHALYQLDPDSWQLHKALGESYASSGQPEKAIVEFKGAVAKQPNNPDLYEALGDEDQHIGRFDDAIRAYQEEVKLTPHNPIALYNLGKIQVERGDPAGGVPLLKAAATAHASPAPTDFYLGLGLAKTGQDKEAAVWLERALENSPSDFVKQGAYFQLSRVYQRLNRKEDSQRALDELKKLKSQAPGPQ